LSTSIASFSFSYEEEDGISFPLLKEIISLYNNTNTNASFERTTTTTTTRRQTTPTPL
jgi:hypothetical protein